MNITADVAKSPHELYNRVTVPNAQLGAMVRVLRRHRGVWRRKSLTKSGYTIKAKIALSAPVKAPWFGAVQSQLHRTTSSYLLINTPANVAELLPAKKLKNRVTVPNALRSAMVSVLRSQRGVWRRRSLMESRYTFTAKIAAPATKQETKLRIVNDVSHPLYSINPLPLHNSELKSPMILVFESWILLILFQPLSPLKPVPLQVCSFSSGSFLFSA